MWHTFIGYGLRSYAICLIFLPLGELGRQRTLRHAGAVTPEKRHQSVCVYQAVQCVNICARVGSVTGLKAGSQSSSVGWSIDGIGSRLPLEVRSTEIVTPAVLSALTGLVNAVIAPAMKQLKREAAAICLSLLSNVQRMTLFRGIGLRSLQKETAFNTNRPTNMAVSDRPKTSVTTRSFIWLSTSNTVTRLYPQELRRGRGGPRSYVGKHFRVRRSANASVPAIGAVFSNTYRRCRFFLAWG